MTVIVIGKSGSGIILVAGGPDAGFLVVCNTAAAEGWDGRCLCLTGGAVAPG